MVVNVGELFTLVSDLRRAGSSIVHTVQEEETVISHLSPSEIHPPPHDGRFDAVTFFSVPQSFIKNSSVQASDVFAVLFDIAVGSTVRVVEPVTSPV